MFDTDTIPQIKYLYFQDKGYEHYLQPLLKKILVCINLIKINNRKKKALNQTQMTTINDQEPYNSIDISQDFQWRCLRFKSLFLDYQIIK